MCRISTGLFVLLVALAAGPLGIAQADDKGATSNVRSLRAVWEAREARFQTWDFHGTGTHFQSGTELAFDSRRHAQQGTGTRDLSDVSFSFKLRMVCDAARKFRAEYEGKKWSIEQKRPVPFTMIETFDGAVCKRSFPDDEIRSGFVYAADRQPWARDLRLLPLLLFFRPVAADFGTFDPRQCQLVTMDAVVGGTRCYLVKQHALKEDQLVWVDPARDYVPIRYSYYYPHRSTTMPAGTIDMEYARDPHHGWVPSSWVNTRLNERGDALERYTLRVSKYSINSPLGSDVFDIPFGPDTWVQNYVTKESYILKANGIKRPVLPGEFTGDNFRDMLRADPPSGWPWATTIIVITAIIVAAAGIFLYRRRAPAI